MDKCASSTANTKTHQVYDQPVKEGGEDEDTQDAEGQNVEDVGQEHLPFSVESILTLLITDGSQCWDCEYRKGAKKDKSDFWSIPYKINQIWKKKPTKKQTLTLFLYFLKSNFIIFNRYKLDKWILSNIDACQIWDWLFKGYNNAEWLCTCTCMYKRLNVVLLAVFKFALNWEKYDDFKSTKPRKIS